MSNLKDLKPPEVWAWLQANNHVEWSKDLKAWLIRDEFIAMLSCLPPAVIPRQELVLPASDAEWELRFINLIADAKVPARLEDGKGSVYYANKFSETGLKVFKKALSSGVIYEVLVKSVMLYYKSNVRYKKAVGNYFRDGDWKTDYEALLMSAEQGSDALNKHIKEEIKPNDGERSNYSLG